MLVAACSDKPGRIARRADGRWKITLIGGNTVPHCTPTKTQELTVFVNDHFRLFAGYVRTAADDPAAPFIVARNPVLDVGSPRALSLAKLLVRECVESHEICSRILPSSETRLPTRAIDCTDPDRPCLSSTEGKFGQYLALSYVWGEAQPHQTTMANVAAYADGIDIALLPQTLRDAIYVTHALGFQYLWADSLCIIQDADEDKLHELGRMHLIYRYAYLTIVAASAERVSDGFLQERPAVPPDITLPFVCPPRPHHDGQQRVGTVHLSALVTLAGETDIEQYNHSWEPISARGWCLQEYLMSPRALIFTSETLQFRCQMHTQNVGGAYYNGPHYSGEQRLPQALFLPDPPPVPQDSEEWRALHGTWRGIVEDYTGRMIGEPSDKLVACGAIAEAFYRVLRADYLAGLWRPTLLRDLLWEVDWDWVQERERDGDAPEFEYRPTVYRAPSWSWASVNGRVRMPEHRELVPIAEVVACTVASKDPELRFGQVAGGSLVLRAALIPCGRDWLDPDKADDRAEVKNESREGTWLVPLLRYEGDRRPEVVGLVVAPGEVDTARNEDGERYRRIGTFSEGWDWDDLNAEGPIPLVEVVLV